jgi:hypothetical protein
MDTLNTAIYRHFTAKEERRRKLAALPFAEKVRIVVRLQDMAAPLLRARGKNVRVWEIDERVA